MVSFLLFACSPALHSQDKLCLVVMYLLSILYRLLNGFAGVFLEMLVSVFIRNIGQSFFVVFFVSGFGIRESYEPQNKHLGSLPVTFSGAVHLQFMLFLPSVFGKTHQCSHVVLDSSLWAGFCLYIRFHWFSVGLFRLCISLLTFFFFW